MRGAEHELILFDATGQRKYLCEQERRRFLWASLQADLRTRLFCQLLAYTGCRISEGLELIPSRLDINTGKVVFRTLKRRRTIHRAVPVPLNLIRELALYAHALSPEDRLWSWCRQTAWRRVKDVMDAAGIAGPQASPKGLRHGFGIASAEKNVPPNLTRKWLGHSRLETTMIYQDAVGQEERRFAKRLWQDYARP